MGQFGRSSLSGLYGSTSGARSVTFFAFELLDDIVGENVNDATRL